MSWRDFPVGVHGGGCLLVLLVIAALIAIGLAGWALLALG